MVHFTQKKVLLLIHHFAYGSVKVTQLFHFNKEAQFGTVDVAVPWAFIQEQEAGFPGREDVMLT